ncbi:MAG: hypothetical protein M1482_13975 [Chloroflexi bacterium]|nr:hypothetical protein [Chloroflexota bacterium]
MEKAVWPRAAAVAAGLVLVVGYVTASAQTPGDVRCVAVGSASGTCNVIGGSARNQIAQGVSGATLAGGGDIDLPNRIDGDYATIGGGLGNHAGDRAVVGGGSDNSAAGYRSFLGGGNNNVASGAYSTLGGGENNISGLYYTTIAGGNNNLANGRNATVGGGSGNSATWSFATVAGGGYNAAGGIDSTIAGGSRNVAAGSFASVGGGSDNAASGFDSTVSGGSGNAAGGENSNVAGGLANNATGKYSSVGGGYENRAGASDVDQVQYAVVAGGSHNTASGFYSTVPGGAENTAGSAYSFAAGRRAVVASKDDGTFLFADSNNADFVSSAPNEFAARATGGARFVTGVDSSGTPTSGVRLPAGSGSWESLSDRGSKNYIAAVDTQAILAQLMTVPITTWSYKSQDPSIKHIGPMAQDFRQFGVGEDGRYISTVDENGIALAAIQGMYQRNAASDQKIKDQDRRIADLESENKVLQNQVASLAQSVADLKQNSNHVTAPVDSSPLVPTNAVLLLGTCMIGWMFVSNRRNFG